MKNLCSGFLVLVLVPGLLAAAQQSLLNHGVPHPPNSYVAGNAIEALIGQFDDDPVADAAFLQGGNLHVVYSVDRIHTYDKVVGPFTSITKVRLTTPEGRDALIAAKAGGLVLLTWTPPPPPPVPLPLPTWTWGELLTDPNWSHAEQLQTVERAGAPTMVCAVSADDSLILSAQWNGSGLTNTASIAAAAPVKSMAGLYWDTNNALDFVYHDGLVLRLVVSSGPSANPFPSTSFSPRLLRLPIPGYDDGVLLVAGNPGGQTLYSLAGELGPSNNFIVMQSIPCAPYTVERLTLTNFDAEPRTDLVLSATRPEGGDAEVEAFARVLFGYAPAVFSYLGSQGPSEVSLADVWSTTCGGPPAVAAGDIDGDGDDDLVYAGSADCAHQVRVFFDNVINEEWAPTPSDQWDQTKAWIASVYFWEESEELPDRFEISPWQLPTAGPSVDSDHLRFRVYKPGEGILFDEVRDATPFTYPLPPGCLPTELFFEFSYVSATLEGDTWVPHRSFPAWVGKWVKNRFFGGNIYNGGLDRPPPPSNPPITHNP